MTVHVHIDERIGAGRLAGTLERAQRLARRDGRPVLVSLTEICSPLDPIALFNASSTYRDRSLWFQPARGFSMVGAGVAHAIEAEGDDRFEAVRRARRELLDAAVVDGPSAKAEGTGPTLLGGFAFGPAREATGLWRGFPAARLILPRLLLTTAGNESFLTFNAMLRPDSDPPAEARALAEELEALLERLRQALTSAPAQGKVSVGEVREAADWQRVVARASESIRRGEAEKIVLAREVDLHAGAPFDVAAALERLARSYPTCYVFAFGHGDQTFLGATPERLVQLHDGELQAACLAGSERRGATPQEDRALGEALMASRKDREEHAIVVRALCEGLSGLSDELSAPGQPELLSVSNVHHLYTPVVARLKDGVCILDAVERLHPTPAVGGYPRAEALAFIRRHEGLDRGWYASPVGWVGPDGGGEFAVALRSALVDGGNAALFAGCGIMGDSDPRREYDESWLKLRPMLSALGGMEH